MFTKLMGGRNLLAVAFCLGVGLVALPSYVTASNVTAADTPPEAFSVESMGWLSGCWASDDEQLMDAGFASGEQWSWPAGGTMLGFGRTIQDGRTVFHEFLMLRQDGDQVELVASPSGQDTTAFKMVSGGERQATFENLENDFPQRIRYHRESEARLVARIEGERQGQTRSVDFVFRRVPCD